MKRLLNKQQIALIKQADEVDGFGVDYMMPDAGFSTTMYSIPLGVLFNDYQDKVYNDDITKKQYNSTISREWEFEQPRDNSEWALQQ